MDGSLTSEYCQAPLSNQIFAIAGIAHHNATVRSITGVKYQKKKNGSAVDFVICLHHGRLCDGELLFVPKPDSFQELSTIC